MGTLTKFAKKQYCETIRDRLGKYRKECLDCIYGSNTKWYDPWPNAKKTVALINKILRHIPIMVWPVKIRSGPWLIVLDYIKKRRTADLRYDRDDHTAWVIESTKQAGKFINYDIGGS
jgi:hypothetical protein